ncbi:MAG: S41 family peptidase [Oceanicaulis sp.]
MFRTIAAIAALALTASPGGAEAQDTYTADEARAELSALYEGLRSAHYDLFESTPEAVYNRRYEALLESFDQTVTADELFVELQRFVALAGHGHARLEGINPAWAAFAESGLVFPLTLTIHHGEVIVEAAPEGSPVRPGDRIVAFDGAPNPIWLERLTRNISAETPQLAYTLLGGRLPLHVWREYGAPEVFNLTIERGGRRDDVTVEAVSLDVWRNTIAPDPGFTLDGRESVLIEPGVAYLRPGPFYDTEAATPEAAYAPEALSRYTAFIDESFDGFIAADAHTLVLDLRDNPGGDVSFSDPVVAWFADQPFSFVSEFRVRVSPETTASNQRRINALPDGEAGISGEYAALFAASENGDVVPFDIPLTQPRDGRRFEGQVLVLINRHSYSNAVTTAALIQDYSFGTLIGEPTLDMATAFGAMERFTLPNTSWTVGYPKGHIVRASGREDLHALTPDITLDLPAVRGALDIALEAALARARR